MHPARMSITKQKYIKISAGKDVEEKVVLYVIGGNVNWYSHEEQFGGSSKGKQTKKLLHNPTPPLWSTYQYAKDISKPMFTVVVFTLAKIWNQTLICNQMLINRQIDKENVTDIYHLKSRITITTSSKMDIPLQEKKYLNLTDLKKILYEAGNFNLYWFPNYYMLLFFLFSFSQIQFLP